ncbi:MAG: GFA family protein [Rhizobacter sp.]|nr:GFA family protein [Rhizobacter sp.]
MAAPYFGHCLCGAIRYRVTAEPLTYYACHCTDCQRRTGAAFGLSMLVKQEAIELLQGEPVAYTATLRDGRIKAGRMCAACGTRLWGGPDGRAVRVLQPGTLEGPTGLAPIAHQWMSEAQPWVVLPEGARRYEKSPADPMEMVQLWRDAHARPQPKSD